MEYDSRDMESVILPSLGKMPHGERDRLRSKIRGIKSIDQLEHLLKELRKLGLVKWSIEEVIEKLNQQEQWGSPISSDCMNLLVNPKLYDIIAHEISKKVEKEEEAILAIFLTFNMRNVGNLSKATDNLMVNDSAGSGKDHITSAVFDMIPDSEKIKRVRITPKVLSYLNDVKSNPEGWTKKCLYLEDVPNSVLNDDSFKVMASADSNGITRTSIIQNNEIKDIDIKGKPVIIITIAVANPKDELLRRFPIANLTSSVDQTKAILHKQALFATKGISSDYEATVKKSLKYLKRVSVRIPYAIDFVNCFPCDNVIVRTHFPRFLDYIKSSCSLHQFNRKTDGEGYFIAQEEDYELARQVLTSTTSNQLMIPLTKLAKGILDIFSNLESRPYFFDELYVHMQNLSGERWIRTQLDRLAEKGFLTKGSGSRAGSIKPVGTYKFNSLQKLVLPRFKDIRNNTINTTTTNNTFNTYSANKEETGVSSNLNELHDLHSEFKNEKVKIPNNPQLFMVEKSTPSILHPNSWEKIKPWEQGEVICLDSIKDHELISSCIKEGIIRCQE
jgi:hypothetical protein